MRRQATRHKDDTWSTAKPDPLELIARFMVGTSYRAPVEGQATRKTSHANEIAGAVGYMRSGLQRDVAVAVATRAEGGDLSRLAVVAFQAVVREVVHLRPRPLDLRDGADRWRLRLVVYDAVHELVWPERGSRQSLGAMAKAAKMRKASYTQVYRCAMSVLNAQLDAARTDFQAKLWGSARD